jgi:hypothetical protein
MTPSPVTAQARVKSVFGVMFCSSLLKSWMIILAVFFFSLMIKGILMRISLLLFDTYFNVQDRECIWLV